ncbi:hypothetical protein Kisp01_46500 [Kineosporia sp. NBRC 101677]|uniref:phosphotransferase n=1 Tax=Kineosporia sp. NBRC 101677 TaxID=3032197 RepID=UPI0024A09D34|nr:phosphotransferase [Kineosporia sp. NBRC 101677]GLY17636.1 hypothetical protein Kisp01_46500 [Kineosporia sp. NBRC 101677]
MRDERVTAAVDWARDVLGPVELHRLRSRPWAVTWRLTRPGHADAFLKCATARTGHEAVVLPVLTRACPALVPELLATDPAGHRLIVASAGTVLREREGDTFRLEVWIPLVQRFAELQRSLTSYVETLLEQGVPDERPHRYLDLLRPFTTAEQVPADERNRLATLAAGWERPTVPHRLRLREVPPVLKAPLVPPSLQHGDLHDNNVAVDEAGAYRFFDFGDSCVAHPFSTMDLPLMFAAEGVDAAGVARLEDAYLEVFTDLAPLAQLRTELRAVLALAPLHRALSWLRALSPDEAATGSEVVWDPVAAAEWEEPILYWLAQLRTQGRMPRT